MPITTCLRAQQRMPRVSGRQTANLDAGVEALLAPVILGGRLLEPLPTRRSRSVSTPPNVSRSCLRLATACSKPTPGGWR